MADTELNGVWPNFIAPSKYEAPDPRWEDPGLPDFTLIWKLAREVGYSVGLHGSMKRDVDLIAAPWTDEAVSAEDFIAHMVDGLNAHLIGEHGTVKPHGRRAWAIQIRDAYKKHMDVSVMPRVTPDTIPLPRAEVEALMEAAQLVSDWDEWALQIGGVCPDRLVGCLGKMRLSLATLQERMK